MSGRLLVVDDDEVTGRILGALLRSEGYVVDVRASGGQALACLRDSPYELLVTDLVMPDMDGLRLVAAARALFPEQRCIVMSGHTRAAACPSDVVWLNKPIDIDHLLGLIERG